MRRQNRRMTASAAACCERCATNLRHEPRNPCLMRNVTDNGWRFWLGPPLGAETVGVQATTLRSAGFRVCGVRGLVDFVLIWISLDKVACG